jgi:hypothetical protein
MFRSPEKIMGFGKKPESPQQALEKLYKTDGEVNKIINDYITNREGTLLNIEMGGGTLLDDRVLLEKQTESTLTALEEVGISLNRQTLESFIESLS